MSNLLSRILGNISTRIMFIIYIMLILLTTFFVIFGYYNQLSLHEEKQYDKLKAIVSSMAINIDGDAYEQMMDENPNKDDISGVDQNTYYQNLSMTLGEAVVKNELSTPIYTLNYIADKNVFCYGVRSDDQVYFRHEYTNYPQVLLEQMDEGGIIPQYESENGIWLSAFFPIKNSNDKTVGLLEADVEFSYFIDMVRAQYTRQALIMLGVIILIALILIPYTRKILREDQKQKETFLMQKRLIEEKNKDITDSINYALKIQNAILPPLNQFRDSFKDSFVFYRSKDIVAGDFYWFEQSGDEVFVAVADCTGHGVPGAMVSVICSNALHRVVNELKIRDTGQILDKTTDLVIETFEKGGQEIKDGMDICFCRFNTRTRELQYSGANNPLYVISDGEFSDVKPDKQPIGKYAERKPFTTHIVDLKEGDAIYLFTDGFADQFGGQNGKKFKYKPFKEMLIRNFQASMQDQMKEVDKVFSAWKGDFEQIDDVCVIGLRV